MADKQKVFNKMTDLVSCFLYYDRKEDDDLPVGEIERLVRTGELTLKQMVKHFKKEMKKGLRP